MPTKRQNVMQRRSILRILMVLTGILVPATPALANSLANWVLVWPGVVSIDPIFGLLPTVLVSLIERPFVSRSGVEAFSLIRSLRANLLSFLVGIPVAMFVWSVNSLQGAVALAFVAVTISIAVEIAYLQSVLRKGSRQLRWLWIILGNFASNTVLVGLALTVMMLQQNYPALGERVKPYQGILMCSHLAISFSVVLAAFAGPKICLLRGRIVGNLTPQPAPIAVGNEQQEPAPYGEE